MRVFLALVLGTFILGQVSTAEDFGPERYITPTTSIRLSADKSPDRKASGVGVRFIPAKDQVASIHTNGELVVWNLADKKPVWRKVVEETGLYYLEVSSEGGYLFVAGKNGVLHILKSADGSEVKKHEMVKPGESYRFSSAKSAPLFAYAGGLRRTDLTWQFFETEEGLELTDQGSDRKSGSFMGTGLAVSPDGSRVALTNAFTEGGFIKNYSLDVYDTTTGERVTSYERSEDMNKISFSPDNKKIAFWSSARDPRVLLLDLETKKETVLHPDIDHIEKVIFSQDGKQVLTSGPRGKVEGKPSFYLRVFDVETAKYASVIAPRSLQPGLDKRVSVADFDTNGDGSKMAVSLIDNDGGAELPDILVFDLK